MTPFAFVMLAVALVPIGLWARRTAVTQVSGYLDADARAKRVRVLRRGGLACWVVAGLFVAFAVVEWIR